MLAPLPRWFRPITLIRVTVVLLRARAWFRRNGRAVTAVALTIGIVAGLVMGLAAGARRTASAPDRYTAAAGGDDSRVMVYQPFGDPLTNDISELPGVADVTAWTFVMAFPVMPDGRRLFDPNTFAGDDTLQGARVVSGRFTDPTAPDEFTVNRVLASRYDLRPGQVFRIAAYDQIQTDDNRFDQPPTVPPFEATLVGIVESPADFDETWDTIVYSEGFLRDHPTVGRVATINLVELQPHTDIDHLISAVRALPGGGDVHPEQTPIVSANARRAVALQTTALWLVVAIALVAAVAVAGLLASRIVGPTEAEQASLSALGSSERNIRSEIVAEAAVLVAMAAPIAVAVGVATSAAFPLGALRLLEPDPGPRFDWLVTAIGIALLLGTTALASMLTGRRRAMVRSGPAPEIGSRLVVFSSVPLVVGAHLAAGAGSGARSGLRRVGLGAVGIAGLVASLIVAASMVSITEDGSRWGIHFDALFGNVFAPAVGDLAAPIVDDPDLSAVAAATSDFLTIDGRALAVFGSETLRGELDPVILAGRAPSGPDEIALGAVIARELDVDVGGTVEASTIEGTTRPLTVVGLAVTPGEAGDGAAMTFEGLARLRPDATMNLVLVRFRDGAPEGTIDRIALSFATPPGALTLPTSVASLEKVIPAPFLLAAVMAVANLLAFGPAIGAAMTARRITLTRHG